MFTQQDRTGATTPAYPWRCYACASENPSGSSSCSACGCPANPTLREVERFRPRPTPSPVDPLAQKKDERLAAAVLADSRYRFWYRSSLSAFLFSLLFPKASGLYMLAIGWLGAQYSLAWFANPLLIAAFILGRPSGDPGSSRGLAYSALAFMFFEPMEAIVAFSPFPFLPWLASALLLIIGMERYRAAWRKPLGTA